MSRLINASREQVEEVYKESHGIWGAGLSVERYIDLWREISDLPWSRKHLKFLVWLDEEGRILSSMKLYRPRVQLLGRISRAVVLGAIYTPKAHRGRRHASDMVRALLRERRRRGDTVALLFSDIGTSYYETLGFRALPAEEQLGDLSRAINGIARDWELRRSKDEDLHAIRRAHSEFTAGRPLALIRDEQHWQFLDVRAAGYFSRLKDPRIKQHCRVAFHNGSFAGYLITVEGRAEWNIREIGAAGGDISIMATIFRMGACEARRSGLRRFYGWLPPELIGLLDDWRLESRPRSKALPMIQFLAQETDLDLLQSVEAAYLPYQDQF
jgi:predicted N-acetyltransferase YhbS